MATLRQLRRAERDFPTTGEFANQTSGLTIYDWAKMFAPGARVPYGGNIYQAYKLDDGGVAATYYGQNPIVFACVAVRAQLFSEMRFQWQQLRNGRPGDLFGSSELAILEEPWPGHTTGDLLLQAELDVSAAGNSYWVKNVDRFQRLGPEKTTVVTAAATESVYGGQTIGDELAGYIYKPTQDPKTWTWFEPREVAHHMPYPDVTNRFRGMSWLSPCLTEIVTDEAINTHKQATISNGASLATVVSFDPNVSTEQFEFFVDGFRRDHEGPENARKTLFLGGGADVKTVGQTFENLMLQATQGGGEVRIAAAAGVPAAIVGFSEGLKGSTLNAGNYGEARRRLADGTLRPLWRSFASCMQSLLTVPASARLWYDDRDIPFLREDIQDEATIIEANAATILKLIQAGFEPDACVDAVTAADFSRLAGHHTGLTSVQLLPPGNGEPYPGIAGEPDPSALPPTPVLTGASNGNSPNG